MHKNNLLTDEHKALIGIELEPMYADVSRKDIVKYSVATEQRQEKFLLGDEAPLMFIFNLFVKPKVLSDLSPDGLEKNGANTLDLPLKRVMAGGTKVKFFRSIFPGDRLVGISKIVDLFEKVGKKGPLIFTVKELAVNNQDKLPVFTEIQTSIVR
jgi:3-methylfumaryl-CoA hydratase